MSQILGPVLNGGAFAAIRDTDNGRYDGDRTWDRAVGPMQFIPSSWALYSRDANGDGTADPHNVDDAALASAGYLCAGDRDLRNTATLRRAVFGYNHSWDYVATVLAWMTAYERGPHRAHDRHRHRHRVRGRWGQWPRRAGRAEPPVVPADPASDAAADTDAHDRPHAAADDHTDDEPDGHDARRRRPPTSTSSPTPTPTPTGCPTPSPTPTETPTDGSTPT